jgi:hypothetical protein
MAFSNPIVAGEDLVRTAIRSPNFLAGVRGWRIAKNGDAEFNDGTFRGDVLIGDATDGFIEITNDPVFGPIVDFIDQGGHRWRLRATVFGTAHNFVIAPVSPGPALTGIGFGYDTATGRGILSLNGNDVALNAIGGDFSIDGVVQGTQNKGAVLAVTDGAGNFTINHGLPAQPTVVVAGAAAIGEGVFAHTFTPTTFKVGVFDTGTKAAKPGVLTGCHWDAKCP